ncbi:MAG: regulatory protein RecX, partial [Brevinematales bacterium]
IKYRPRSVLEVRERMKLKGIKSETAEKTIMRLLEEGLLDDAGFAKMWAMERASCKNFGPARIRSELRKKGIDNLLITDILYEMSDGQDTIEMALKMLNRKFRDIGSKDDFQLISFLVRGGYSSGEAKEAVKRARSAD